MNRRAFTISSHYSPTANGTVHDNTIFTVVIAEDGIAKRQETFYYRRRTSFAGVYTGPYREAVRLAKESVNNAI